MKNWAIKATKYIYIEEEIWELTKLWVMRNIEDEQFQNLTIFWESS